jgi:hypothetical protein
MVDLVAIIEEKIVEHYFDRKQLFIDIPDRCAVTPELTNSIPGNLTASRVKPSPSR